MSFRNRHPNIDSAWRANSLIFTCASLQEFGDRGPFVSVDRMGIENDLVLFRSPFSLVDFWVQVVIPPLAALLPHSAWDVLGDLGPVFSSVFLDQFDHLMGRKSYNHSIVETQGKVKPGAWRLW